MNLPLLLTLAAAPSLLEEVAAVDGQKSFQKSFDAKSLELYPNQLFKITVEPYDGTKIVVAMIGPEAEMAGVKVKEVAGVVSVTASPLKFGVTKLYTRKRSNGEAVVILNGDELEETDFVRVKVLLPTGTPFTLDGDFIQAQIGDLESNIEVVAGSLLGVTVGRVKDAQLTNLAVGRLEVAYVAGKVVATTIGVGAITIKDGQAETLHVQSNKVGKVTYQGKASEANVLVLGVGAVELSHVNGPSLKVTTQGVGSVFIHSAEVDQLEFSTQGVGSIVLHKGKAKKATLSVNLTGSIQYEGVITEVARIENVGTGFISCGPIRGESLTATLKGLGKVGIVEANVETMDLNLEGGTLTINEGLVQKLEATATSMAKLLFDGTAIDADLSVESMAILDVYEVTGKLTQKRSGMMSQIIVRKQP